MSSAEDQRPQAVHVWSLGWQDKEPMSCSLTLQKFLPGGLHVLSDSRGMFLPVKQRISRLRWPFGSSWQGISHSACGRPPYTARQQRLCIFCYTLLVNSWPFPTPDDKACCGPPPSGPPTTNPCAGSFRWSGKSMRLLQSGSRAAALDFDQLNGNSALCSGLHQTDYQAWAHDADSMLLLHSTT